MRSTFKTSDTSLPQDEIKQAGGHCTPCSHCCQRDDHQAYFQSLVSEGTRTGPGTYPGRMDSEVSFMSNSRITNGGNKRSSAIASWSTHIVLAKWHGT